MTFGFSHLSLNSALCFLFSAICSLNTLKQTPDKCRIIIVKQPNTGCRVGRVHAENLVGWVNLSFDLAMRFTEDGKRTFYNMENAEILTKKQVTEAIKTIHKTESPLSLSLCICGKWKTASAKIAEIGKYSFLIKFQNDIEKQISLKTDQPVGINCTIEHKKFVFESKIIEAEKPKTHLISLQMPEKIEKLPRRSYIRVPVPQSLVVKVMFWHRGYDDNKNIEPAQDYWQGRLLNISAGGMMINIDKQRQQDFETSQLVGLQFTPMPYEKPILLEALIRHKEADPDTGDIHLGLQFLGLEASKQGRQKLHYLTELIKDYETINNSTDQPQTHPPHED